MDQYAQPRHPEYQYLDILREILDHGDKRMDRTGVGTLALFGRHMRYDVSQTFPVLTTRKIYWRTAIKEMLWMLSGSSNIRDLLEQDVHIWTAWPLQKYREVTGENISQAEFEARILDDDKFADKWAALGPVYGKQWRRWLSSDGREIDQIEEVIDQIRKNPTSRRIIWEGWFTWIVNRFGRFDPALTVGYPTTFDGPTQQHRARSASRGKRPLIRSHNASDKP